MTNLAHSKYDVVIVGSGIAGALAALRLAQPPHSKKVLVLEAGEPVPPNINEEMDRFYRATAKVPESAYKPDLLQNPSDPSSPLRDPSTVPAGRPTVLSLAGAKSWRNPKQSYLIQTGDVPFGSTYERIGGGTSLHWLGTSLRFLPNDFRMNDQYQLNWPKWPKDINYKSLEDWYCRAEREIGVSASVEEQSYAGVTFGLSSEMIGYTYPMPAIPPSLTDKFVAGTIDGMIIEGNPIKVRSTPAARNSQPFKNRRVCAGNTNCIPICPIQAKYDPTITLRDAQATGNVDFLYRTVAYNIALDPQNTRRVIRIDYKQYNPDGSAGSIGAAVGKVFIIAANAIETPRLLLMSNSQLPEGVANKSGQVGRNLMDHPFYVIWGLLPRPTYPYRGPLSTSGIEDLRDGSFRSEHAAFRVEMGNDGWNFAIGGEPNITTVDFVNGLNNSQVNPTKSTFFGSELIQQLRDVFTSQFRLGFLIEQQPEEKNRVTLSAHFKDGLGLPRPEVCYGLSDYTLRGLSAAKQAGDAIFAQLNVRDFTKYDESDSSVVELPPNSTGRRERVRIMGAGHIMGTHRMGEKDEQATSVVDANQQAHDHDNLYLIGSGSFPTSATANPTLTLAALTLRTADWVATHDLKT
jgi:choline dehydrogenase-like flavoprotein